MRAAYTALAVLFALAVVEARLGVDVSSLFPQSSWECLTKKGYEFAIVRCYCSTNQPDSHCAETVKRAWAGGMKHVDLYMFPCPKCGNHVDQVKRLDKHIRDNNITYGQIWIDIEGIGTYWYDDKMQNRKIFNTLMTAATETFGTRFAGCYVSHRSWLGIFGEDYKDWGNLKVWYALWDHKPGKGNWQPYGSFKGPTIHQYEGDYKGMCNMDVDLDWSE